LLAKVDRILEDAEGWILRGLDLEPVEASERAARQKVAADLTELRALAGNLRIESGVSGQEIAAVLALEQRLVALLPLVTGVEERLSASARARRHRRKRCHGSSMQLAAQSGEPSLPSRLRARAVSATSMRLPTILQSLESDIACPSSCRSGRTAGYWRAGCGTPTH
jgi:hypothetical protein